MVGKLTNIFWKKNMIKKSETRASHNIIKDTDTPKSNAFEKFIKASEKTDKSPHQKSDFWDSITRLSIS